MHDYNRDQYVLSPVIMNEISIQTLKFANVLSQIQQICLILYTLWVALMRYNKWVEI